MRRAFLMTFGSAALLSAACPDGGPDNEACLDACGFAQQCGILPSTLGGNPGDGPEEAFNSCTLLCVNSELTDEVQRLLECLIPDHYPESCDVDACADTIDCLTVNLPGPVIGAAEVTFRLIDGAFWTLLFQPELCDQLPPDLSIAQEDIDSICAGDDDPCHPGAPGVTTGHRLALCSGDACHGGVNYYNCDARLCTLSPAPSIDCADFGVESVQFGYFDLSSTLHLDETTYSCAEAGEGQVVPGVDTRVIYPVALFRGHITSHMVTLLGAPSTAVGREYCWLSHPSHPLETGWLIQTGSTLVPVPSPSSAELASNIYADPSLFPRGCNCLIGNIGCEDPDFNENCDNELDDDGDGLVDAEDPGCAP